METLAKRRQTCPHCGHTTTFCQKREAVNWLLHLIMMMITGGLWIPVFLLAVSFSVVKIGFIQADWVCSECGYIDRDALNKRRRVLKAVSLAWLLFYGFGLLDWMLQTPS